MKKKTTVTMANLTPDDRDAKRRTRGWLGRYITKRMTDGVDVDN